MDEPRLAALLELAPQVAGVDAERAVVDQGIEGRPRDADPEKLQAAVDGPCRKYAGDAFGTTGADDPDLQDQITKLKACLRDQGIETSPQIDRGDPGFDKALDACRDQVPRPR